MRHTASWRTSKCAFTNNF